MIEHSDDEQQGKGFPSNNILVHDDDRLRIKKPDLQISIDDFIWSNEGRVISATRFFRQNCAQICIESAQNCAQKLFKLKIAPKLAKHNKELNVEPHKS